MAIVEVKLPNHQYEVRIEPGILKRGILEPGILEGGSLENLGSIVREFAPASKCAVVTDSAVNKLYGESLKASLEKSSYHVQMIEFPGGEAHKSLQTVSSCYDSLLNSRLDRRSPVIGLGGGVVGDTAGFVAATYLRGVPFIQVPCSLLAMVDASVGGKVGVNVPQGKNLVGAFYQPKVVVIDPNTLKTLPHRELLCGLAECVKHGLLADEELFAWTRDNVRSILDLDPETLVTLISRNVAIKAAIVAEDEKERGKRALLNLGHTFGHAIEKTSAYSIQHGEGVALGILAAVEVSCRLERCTREEQKSIEDLLSSIGLPLTAELTSSADLLAAMKLDKKVLDDAIRLVLLNRIGEAEVVDGVEESEIIAGFDRIRS